MMRFLEAARIPVLFVALVAFQGAAKAQPDEQRTIGDVMMTLDYFMRAGVDMDPKRGAMMMEGFVYDARRTEHDTRRLYTKQRELLNHYVSIDEDIYGYEIKTGLLGSTVEVEGGIATEEGLVAEFKARVIYRGRRWLIADLEID